jgi:flagellar FliL protein
MGKAATKAVEAAPAEEAPAEAPARRGRKKLLLLAVPLLVVAVGAGLWFGGILPPLLGMGGAGKHGQAADAKAVAAAKPPTFLEMPEIVANLNVGPRQPGYIKLQVRLELAKADDEPAVRAVMPRLMDLFETYLREMSPEELRGSQGSYRLREELLNRANVATAPARVRDVLFTEMLIQ